MLQPGLPWILTLSRATEQYCGAGAILKPLCLSKQLTLCSQQLFDQLFPGHMLQTMFSCNMQHFYFAQHVYRNNYMALSTKELINLDQMSCMFCLVGNASLYSHRICRDSIAYFL